MKVPALVNRNEPRCVACLVWLDTNLNNADNSLSSLSPLPPSLSLHLCMLFVFYPYLIHLLSIFCLCLSLSMIGIKEKISCSTWTRLLLTCSENTCTIFFHNLVRSVNLYIEYTNILFWIAESFTYFIRPLRRSTLRRNPFRPQTYILTYDCIALS